MPKPPESRLAYSTDGSTEIAAAPPRKKERDDRTPPAGSAARAPGIRIHLDRRASDRVVTVVSGLAGAARDREALARELKARCGTGGTLKEGVLELQGDHRASVEAALAARGLKSKRAGG